ncbi:MAG: hypothetical protein ACTTJH_04130 [Bacteroidales bacterium]
MKKINTIIVALFICTIPFIAHTQTRNPDWKALHQKMLEQKYEFLKNELALEDKMMAKFWDLYLIYDKEVFACHEDARKKRCELIKSDPNKCEVIEEDILEDDIAIILIEQRINMEKHLLEIENQFTQNLLKVLPAQKVLKLHRLEKQFIRQFMKEKLNGKKECFKDQNTNSVIERQHNRTNKKKMDIK